MVRHWYTVEWFVFFLPECTLEVPLALTYCERVFILHR